MSCDHVVGVCGGYDGDTEFLLQSEIPDTITRCHAARVSWANSRFAYLSQAKEVKEESAVTYLKYYYSLFSFCPKCGERLPEL